MVTNTHNHALPDLMHVLKPKTVASQITKRVEEQIVMKSLLNENIKPVGVYDE